MSDNEQQLEKFRHSSGFIAALDQSGGSTPKALALYGVHEDQYACEDEMYIRVHEMRTRIMTNPYFTGEHILAAILFENTMDRTVEGIPTSQYLWQTKNIVPILKVDKGLADEENGVQIMKPMPELAQLLERAEANGIFGTKMRSVIKQANADGIKQIVKQQFEIGKQVIDKGFVPIIEPEVDIHSSDKAQSEEILINELNNSLANLANDSLVIFKLTLPEEANLYKEFVSHNNVLKVVALSGGYSREEANQRLSENNGMVASFSRALSEGLSVEQTDEAFGRTLGNSIDAIVAASAT